MKKKILMITVALMAMVMLATPVFAGPTKGQKASIELRWFPNPVTVVDDKWSDGVRHRHAHQTWNVELEIDGVGTLFGTAFTERNAIRVIQPDGANNLLNDYYVLTFADGGFEGNALILMRDVIPGTPPTGMAKAHGLFKGTGAFEGQTINGGHGWTPIGGPPVWYGYLLKP